MNTSFFSLDSAIRSLNRFLIHSKPLQTYFLRLLGYSSCWQNIIFASSEHSKVLPRERTKQQPTQESDGIELDTQDNRATTSLQSLIWQPV